MGWGSRLPGSVVDPLTGAAFAAVSAGTLGVRPPPLPSCGSRLRRAAVRRRVSVDVGAWESGRYRLGADVSSDVTCDVSRDLRVVNLAALGSGPAPGRPPPGPLLARRVGERTGPGRPGRGGRRRSVCVVTRLGWLERLSAGLPGVRWLGSGCWAGLVG